MRERSRSRGWYMLLLLGLVSMGGCYRYAPVGLNDIGLQDEVRARVGLEQVERLEGLFPTRNPRVVEGRVAGINPDDLIIDIMVAGSAGIHLQGLDQRVDLPIGSILEVERKEFDRFSTFALASVGAALVGVVLARIALTSGSSSPLPPPTGPLESPSVRFR